MRGLNRTKSSVSWRSLSLSLASRRAPGNEVGELDSSVTTRVDLPDTQLSPRTASGERSRNVGDAFHVNADCSS